MQRFEHPRSWKPKPRQAYYFAHWDMCIKCRHIQHYESAKVFVAREHDWPEVPEAVHGP